MFNPVYNIANFCSYFSYESHKNLIRRHSLLQFDGKYHKLLFFIIIYNLFSFNQSVIFVISKFISLVVKVPKMWNLM